MRFHLLASAQDLEALVEAEGLDRLVAKLRSVRADAHLVEVKSAVGKLPKSLAKSSARSATASAAR